LVTIGFLVVFPLLAAAALFLIRKDSARSVVVIGSAAVIMLGCIWLAISHLTGTMEFYPLRSDVITYTTVVIDVVLGVYVFVKGIRYGKPFASVLAGIQTVIVVVFELFVAHSVQIANDIYIDSLSVLMALIIGLVGSGICVYALGYMKDFQAQHANEPDRRHIFFSVFFLFLSAMFALVFSNNLGWLFCAWEVTTVCSFALIGYTRSAEAIDNSFRQIIMNLLGGLAFAIALVYLGAGGVLELDQLINLGAAGFAGFPIALLAFAGITKAAQIPFQSWLLGAMVAPTPTSALLHSSTMVKAGVFLLAKLSPAFGWNFNGMMVILIGGITFLFCAFVAISQSNAKRVLAYSTVSNLGLIVACAGVGTPEAMWAAIFLLLFHAVAKSLLFLCVGTAEHHIGSRDIEDMDNLFVRMPAIARFMALGMLCMFIAPFGMLVSKWATIVSIVDSSNLTLMLILAFGSAATFMFWAKWLGKILAVAQDQTDVEKTVHRSEWFAIGLMATLVLLCSIAFPWISEAVVVPYLRQFEAFVFPGLVPGWGQISATLSFDNLLIMAIIVLAIILTFVVFFGRSKKRTVDIYMAGVGLDSQERSYRNSLSDISVATQRNWYLESWFGEKALLPVGNIMCVVVLVVGVGLAYLNMGGGALI
jgi:ech hydrogenase subunit A